MDLYCCFTGPGGGSATKIRIIKVWLKIISELRILKSLSSRLVAASWWMFVLLMLSCYTANLAAFLTINKMDSTINSVEDLLRQNKVKVGVRHKNNIWLRLLKVGKYFLSLYVGDLGIFRKNNRYCFRNPEFQQIKNWEDS